MASDGDACWRCGVRWAAEDEPRRILRVVGSGAPSEVGRDTGRWINEGGSVAAAGG